MAGTELLTKARAGDGEAFRQLTAPHHRELQVHCYRMLGSLQDAEDALQDTLLDAWRGLAGFEGRSSIRTWLYRVATNRCLNALRTANRRPAKAWGNPEVEPPEPTRLGEVMWLEPYPDALLDGALAVPGPEARYEQTEAISLAFTTAVQLLPARQRAVLILRDVLGYRADEVAGMLDSTTESVYSALKRARAGLERGLPAGGPQEPPPAPDSPTERALVDGFVRAYASGDVEALVSLLAEDAARIRGPGRRDPLLHHGHEPQLVARPRAHPGQRPAGVRVVPGPGAGQAAARHRPHRAHPRRRPDRRPRQVRQRRAAGVRPAAGAPRPMSGPRTASPEAAEPPRVFDWAHFWRVE
jgi:RNA polymerase sigma-70 factor (ECF subfamily)